MERVLVIGSPGSGKSTFARGLHAAAGLPLYYLDMIWHLPDGTSISCAEFDERLEAILRKDRWILDGNYSRTLRMRLSRADTVFVFDLPTEVCIEGALSRIGKKREDLPWLETKPDPEFIRYIGTFREEKMPLLLEMLREFDTNKTVHIFKSRQEADAYLLQLTTPHG